MPSKVTYLGNTKELTSIETYEGTVIRRSRSGGTGRRKQLVALQMPLLSASSMRGNAAMDEKSTR